MNESKIQNALYEGLLAGSQICVPNYTPSNWWECDLMHITKAGYMVEHEIKLSKSDFMADAKKEKFGMAVGRSGNQSDFKHDLLRQGDSRGPRQFWFVVSQSIVDSIEIPEFAGLKVVSETVYGTQTYLDINVVKKAPFLHKEKVHPSVVSHAESVFYYRYWNLRHSQS